MRKKEQFEMEAKIRKAVDVEDPRSGFVESLRQRIAGQGSSSYESLRLYRLSHRPVWFFLVIGFILISAIYFAVGPENVQAFIEDFNFLDQGLQTVEEAGMVTELGITPQPTVLSPDSSIDDITVILDWVYIDESRLVLGVIADSLPSGLVLGTPNVVAEQGLNQNLVFNSITVEDNPNQVIFLAFNPLRMDIYDERVDFSVDIPLTDSGDPVGTPLAVYHYDLEGIPVYEGQTYEIAQSPSAKVGGFDFRMESFMLTPSFTEVTFCVNMSSGEILALPRSDISLQIGDGPVMYDFLILNIEEDEERTCVQIGFFDGGTPKDELIVFRFKQSMTSILRACNYEPGQNIKDLLPIP